MSSDFEGRNVEIFMNDLSTSINGSSKLNSMEFPEGVAIDWVARNIYWTDSGKKTVEVARLDDGRSRSKTIPRVILFDEQIQNPRGIAVHPSARYILVYSQFRLLQKQFVSCIAYFIIWLYLIVAFFGPTGIDFTQE